MPYTEIRETIGQSQATFVHAWQSSLKAASDDYTHRVRQLWENVFDDILRLSGRSEQDLRGLPHEEAVRLYVSTLEECRSRDLFPALAYFAIRSVGLST